MTALINATMRLTSPATAAKRSIAARIGDVYNVKDWGAKGDNTTNDSPAIQAAITAAVTAAQPGGIIFFPVGQYYIGTRLVVPGNSNAALTFMGCGNRGGAVFPGSTLINQSATVFNDYLLYIGHNTTGVPTCPVRAILNMGFFNGSCTTVCTSTEPPLSPDGTSGNGCGCLYIGAGTIVTMESVDMQIGVAAGSGNRGICCYSAADHLVINGYFWQLDTVPAGAPRPPVGNVQGIILMCRGHVHISSGKLQGGGTQLNAFGGTLVGENMNNEVGGVAFDLGAPLISAWDPVSQTVVAAGTAMPITSGYLNDLTHESLGFAHVWMRHVSNFTMDGVGITSLGPPHPDPDWGIRIESVNNCIFRNMGVGGNGNVAAISIGQAGTGLTAGTGGNLIFENVSVTGGYPTFWQFPPASWYGSVGGGHTYDNNIFRNCFAQDGGVTRANLSPSPAAAGTVGIVVTDSVDQIYPSGVSNAGKPLTMTGTGTNRVVVRWDGTQYILMG